MKHPLLLQLSHIQTSFSSQLDAISSLSALEQFEKIYWGKKEGSVTALLQAIKELSVAERKEVAPVIQQWSRAAQELVAQHRINLIAQSQEKQLASVKHFDVTAPACNQKPALIAQRHPGELIMERIDRIMQKFNIAPAQGPEIEDAWHNFQALNIPENHPARDMQDTFWLNQKNTHGESLLLRTHTSSVQIRTLKKHTPPLAIYALGRVYRHEATDATHEYTFHQLEILWIDKGISIANLSTLLKAFMQELFENTALTIRLRPSYFPFVEPGLEVDISCLFCTNGCPTCKKSGFIEIGGAGLVHPHTLMSGNIDPQEYSGIAWGLGIERIAMLVYGIDDIRLFHHTPPLVRQQWL